LKIFMSANFVFRYIMKVKLIISQFCWTKGIFLSNESPLLTQKIPKKSDLDEKDKKLTSNLNQFSGTNFVICFLLLRF
jgi:hypothetical protein